MAVRKIMIIRHAEKPPKDGSSPQGVDLKGSPSPDQLIPKGWQRAGALSALFAPLGGRQPQLPLERPAAVFAAGTSATSTSLRPQATVGPVALALGRAIAVTVLGAPGEEVAAAACILGSEGEACLVCWEHKHIKDLVEAITKGTVPAPHWDGTRFDAIFVLTRDEAVWSLQEVPQLLLAGDLCSTVSQPDPAAGADPEDS